MVSRKTKTKLKKSNTNKFDFLIYDLVREDGRLERVCSHGIGHTVGHLDSKQLKDEYMWVHGCDGCCGDYEIMKAK